MTKPTKEYLERLGSNFIDVSRYTIIYGTDTIRHIIAEGLSQWIAGYRLNEKGEVYHIKDKR